MAMKSVEDMPKIPMSRFIRNLTSITRRKEVVCVTTKGKDDFVFVPKGTEEFNFMTKICDTEE